MCFATLMSMLSIGGVCSVLRPDVAIEPCPATMYWALGLFATQPTMQGGREQAVLLVIGETSLPTPLVPAGLKMARSGAASAFMFESMPLCTVPHWPDS